MTTNEEILFKIACRWKARYERTNPDIGMGPFATSIIKDIEEESGVKFDALDFDFQRELSTLLL